MNKSDLSRDNYMLNGSLAKQGYDWWWHSFTGINVATGAPRTFFVEFFIINPALSPDEVVLGQDVNNINNRLPSYAMLNVGTWGKNHRQLHNYFPLSECTIDTKKLNITFKDNFLSETQMRGCVKVSRDQAFNPGYMCDSGKMVFDLRIKKQISFNVGYGANSFFRKLNAFEMFWHAEGMKTLYEGTVKFNNNEYVVKPESCYGYADKNWGKDFTSPWVWFSSCNLTSKLTGKKLNNSVFDIGGGRPKAFGIPLNRKLLIDFYYEGKDYEYNFSKFWTSSKIEFNCFEQEKEIIWDIKAVNRNSRMEFKGHCLKSEMLLINYEAPNGKKLHNRLWNGGTGFGELKLFDKHDVLIDDIEFKNGGCEYGEYNV